MLVLLLLLPLVLLVSCAASFCRLRQNFRALTSRIAVGSWSACCCCFLCCSGSVGAKAFFSFCLGITIHAWALYSSSCLRCCCELRGCVCVSEFRIAWTYFFIFILRWYLYFLRADLHSETIALFCNSCGVVICISLSLSSCLLFSSAPIACKMSGNCQLEFMTCLLSEI